MRSLELCAFAKINLGINVFERLETGYHRVDMVIHAIELCDKIRISAVPSAQMRIEIECVGADNIPKDCENIACKAAYRLLSHMSFKADVRIGLEKRIPAAAGLAGGSSDAAAVLLALNELLNIRLNLDELAEIGATVGADIPFCVYANALGNREIFDKLSDEEKKRASVCMRARGIGEELAPLNSIACKLLLFKPNLEVSTKEVYTGLDELDAEKFEAPDIEKIVLALQEDDIDVLAESAGNVLEAYTLERYPQVHELKRYVSQQLGAKTVLMSGSGPTIFALYNRNEKLDFDFEKLKNVEVIDTFTLKKGE